MRDLNYYGNLCIKHLNTIGIYPNDIEEWQVNNRAKRFGQCKKENGTYTINININLLNENVPELSLMETIFHELLHAVDGCMNHGNKWQELAELVSDCYNVNITRCSSYEEKYGSQVANEILQDRKLFAIKCQDCGCVYKRMGYRRPKWYIHTDSYKCKCGGKLYRI